MGAFSLWHWLIILAVVLLLFGGGGKIPKLMRDMGSGITAFRKGLKDDDKKESDEEGEETKALEGTSSQGDTGGAQAASDQPQTGSENSDRKAANG